MIRLTLPETNELAFPAPSFREGGKNKRGVPMGGKEKDDTQRGGRARVSGSGKNFFHMLVDRCGARGEDRGRGKGRARGREEG